MPHNPGQPGSDEANSRINFHHGKVLLKLSNTYSKLHGTVLEIIQNGFDAGADRIMVFIDYKQHEVIVFDNGEGTDKAKFDRALASVGNSVKKPGSLGQFGLGLISPLNKCVSFTFTSQGQNTPPMEWTFRKEDIAVQTDDVHIPWRHLARMPQVPPRFQQFATGEYAARYRTMVMMRGVTTDRATSLVDLEELAYDIQTKFMGPMNERKALVRLVLKDIGGRLQSQDVNPLTYTGEPLPPVTYASDETGAAGRVEFQLFRARRIGGQRRGKVSVWPLGDTSPITIGEFMAQARGHKLDNLIAEAIEALASGHFEGQIRCENVELATNRKKFVWGDPLETLYLVIAQWYDEHGRVQHQGEQDISRQTRWQELGLKSQDRLHALLHTPQFAQLKESLLFAVEFGRTGSGHLEPQKGKPDGPDDDRSIRVGQGGAGVERTPRPTPAVFGPRKRAPQTRDGDVPLTVSGPNGQRRRLVKGDSEGLQLAHAELPGDSRLWSFDFRDGTITFNTLHAVWVMLDETKGKHLARNAKWIMHLQEWLTLEVLTLLHLYPDRDEFELRRDFVDTQIRPYVELRILGESKRS